MAVTVNADDFGISSEVNGAIAQSFAEGLINRTTLMANMPYAKEAMEIAAKEGFIQNVGIHLNLTKGRPLTEIMAGNRVMCNEEGEFTADFARSMKSRFFLDRSTSNAIEQELVAQLDKYRELGGTLWHIDSHHHVHTDPSIWRPLRKVLKRYPITSVRLGRNMYRGGNPVMRLYKLLLNASIKSFCNKNSNLFGSALDYDSFTESMSSEMIEKMRNNKGIEIMVHPMYDTSGNITDSMESFKKYI